MTYQYNDQNIFAKILRGEIPSNKVYEDEFSLAFHDIQPQAPTHVLVIPKGPWVSWDHMAAEAGDAAMAGYMRAVAEVCRILGLTAGEGGMGYRLIVNTGEAGVQEVPHLHTHILSGRVLGRMVKRFDD